jgi:pimeloyl-ACP methyl ester carboxylesterase
MSSLWQPIAFLIVASTAFVHADSVPALREHKVDVGGNVSLRVIEAGKFRSGAPPALVFIPGWSTGADIWRRQIDTFAKTNRVIAFDPRSEGESTQTTSGNTPETRAQDLHALLDRLNVRRPVLIGWSQGVQDVAA